MNENTEPFKLLECEIRQIIYEGVDGGYTVGIQVGDDEIGVVLNGYDGSLLTFADVGCAEKAHINTIHQILIRFKKDCGFDLSRILIEAKYGDVIYCRGHWVGEKSDFYNVLSIGDALILQSLTKCSMFITQNVYEQFEKFDSDGYMENFDD